MAPVAEFRGDFGGGQGQVRALVSAAAAQVEACSKDTGVLGCDT